MSWPLAFIDCETSHLDAEIGEAWEVAVILRESDAVHSPDTDTEYVWQVRPDLTVADPESLKIGRFEERFCVPPHVDAAFTGYEDGPVVPMTRDQAVSAILTAATLAGAVGMICAVRILDLARHATATAAILRPPRRPFDRQRPQIRHPIRASRRPAADADRDPLDS